MGSGKSDTGLVQSDYPKRHARTETGTTRETYLVGVHDLRHLVLKRVNNGRGSSGERPRETRSTWKHESRRVDDGYHETKTINF